MNFNFLKEKEENGNKFFKNSISKKILIIQLLLIILFGYGLSTGVPGAIFAPDGAIVLTLSIVSFFIFPVIGIIGLITAANLLRKKIHTRIATILFITSLLCTTLFPVRFIAVKIAGLLNQEWTKTYQQQEQEKSDKERENYAKVEKTDNQLFAKKDRILKAHFEYYIKEFSSPQYLVPEKHFLGGVYVTKNNTEVFFDDSNYKKEGMLNPVTLRVPSYQEFENSYKILDEDNFVNQILLNADESTLKKLEDPHSSSWGNTTLRVPVFVYYKNRLLNEKTE